MHHEQDEQDELNERAMNKEETAAFLETHNDPDDIARREALARNAVTAMGDEPTGEQPREDYLDQRREYREWEAEVLPAWEEQYRPAWEDQRRDAVEDTLRQEFEDQLPALVDDAIEVEWETERERAWEAVREDLYERFQERQHET